MILICLAVWQYQRLQWKTALLEEVELAVSAPPLKSLKDLQAAIAAGVDAMGSAQAPARAIQAGFSHERRCLMCRPVAGTASDC